MTSRASTSAATAPTSGPADLTDEQTGRIREIAARAFDAVDGRGLARVDVFLTDDGEVIVNELNTMPGFTPISMYPKCWVATGLSYADLISELIELGARPADYPVCGALSLHQFVDGGALGVLRKQADLAEDGIEHGVC